MLNFSEFNIKRMLKLIISQKEQQSSIFKMFLVTELKVKQLRSEQLTKEMSEFL
ncbi:hypothetical protein pb186bvf_015896 [Paramecium bursaria]